MIGSGEKMKIWEENTTIAAREFNWDNEKEKLLAIFKKIG
jgi:hypothetical protein